MKHTLLTTIRNKNTPINAFRNAAERLGIILATEVAQLLEKQPIMIETPLGETKGTVLKHNITLVPILRSGMALLHPFLTFFPYAKVGFVGLKRDEVTAVANLYYYNVPPIAPNDDVILLDPMIATGGSAIDALKILVERGAKEEKIIFAAVVASKDGLNHVQKTFPKLRMIVPEVDETLNDKKFIVPGLGDFGDRFYGTEQPEF